MENNVVIENTTIRRIRWYLVIPVAALATILISLIYIQSGQTQSITVDTDTMASFPVSTSESVDDLEGIVFKNESQFEKTNIKTFVNEFCEAPDDLKYSVDIDTYVYSVDSNSEIGEAHYLDTLRTIVSRNASQNDYDEPTAQLFNTVKQILAGNYDESTENNAIVESLFVKACSGGSIFAVDDVTKIEYNGTDSAYMILSHGSTQSTTTSLWMPLQLVFIFKVNDDYGYSLVYIDDYDSLTLENNLAECEIESEYGYRYIQDNDCVKRVLMQDLDTAELESIKNEWLQIFELTE